MGDHSDRNDRQRALADFGDFVLDHDDLDEILTEGCRLVAATLGADLAKIMEIERGSNTAIVRAGVGWHDGVIGRARVDLNDRSSEAYAIEEFEPVITNDISDESRFVFPRFLRDHGVVALVNVPILLPGRKPFGILQVDARHPRSFDRADIEFLKTYAMVLGPVIDRLKTVAELRATDKRLRLVVDNARAYVLIVSDADDKITDWLGGSEQILGWTAAEAVGQGADMIFTEDDRANGVPERELANARECGHSADIRWHLRKDGSKVFLDGQTIALRDASDTLKGYYKIGQDQTERKRNEDQQAFLLELSDSLRSLSTVEEIALEAAQRLGPVLNVHRVIYGAINDSEMNVSAEYTAGVRSLLGRHHLTSLGAEFLGRYKAGNLVTSNDVAAEAGINAAGKESLLNRQVAAFADLVIFDDGSIVNFLGVQSASPRTWSSLDQFIIREVGERLRVAIDRARAEGGRRESEARLRQFGEASSDVIWIRDADTLQWEYLSPAFETVYGIAVEKALTADNIDTWREMIVESDRERVIDHLDRVRAGDERSVDFRIRRPDGEIRWLRDASFPIRSSDGRVQRIGGIRRDVTQSKLAEERLVQSEERLSSAVEVGKLGLWDWDVRTGAIHWSDEHFRMEGYEVGEITPSYDAWVSRIHPDDRSAAEEAIRRSMEGREEFAHEFRTVHPDGSVHWLSGRGKFFYDDARRPLRMVGAMVETTERRAWEERQKVLVAELQHRTRNLIAVVRSVAETTARSSIDLADFRVRYRDRLDALARVQGLLSRLKDDVDRVTFDDLIHMELSAVGASSERTTVEGPAGVRLRSSTVQMLAMAIHELATNAVKYGALGRPSGRLSVTWSLDPDEDDGRRWLHINWAESGVDMSAAGSVPRGTGQGRELIEKALPYQLGARTAYSLGAGGIHCTISIPVSNRLEDPHD